MAIYHEKQFGSLCGQHCLNNLLQGPYFTGVYLADIACELDQAEKALLGGGDVDTPSSNVDDSGNFSIQVITTALKRSHDIVLLQGGGAMESMLEMLNNDSVSVDIGFVCHLESHWFTIRKIFGDFWNLNSLNKSPERISIFYLSAYLGQLREEGWSIFTVKYSTECPPGQPNGILPLPMNDPSIGNRKNWFVFGEDEFISNDAQDKDSELQQALKMSLIANQVSNAGMDEEEDPELAAALRLSMQP